MLRRILPLLCWSLPAVAQVIIVDWPGRDRFPVPMPMPHPIRADCRIKSVEVRASVDDQAAKVSVEQVFQNPSAVAMEAQVLFPLPPGAAVSGLTLIAGGHEMPGKLL